MLRLLPDVKVGRSDIRSITLRGFPGGLNTLDSDIGIDAKFVVKLNNFVRTPNGSHRVRYGTRWFTDIATTSGILASSAIVDMEYFVNAIWAVTNRGETISIDVNGNKTMRWSQTIGGVPPVGGGWVNTINSTTTVDFVPFKGKLIIHNGVDKPIIVQPNLSVGLLEDLASGSSVNVPIGRFGCTVTDYHCVAGIALQPTTIYVSSKGTEGTFYGDPAPNDGIFFDVGAYAPEGAPEIRGIAGFRSYLIVFFATQSLVIKLGNYEERVVGGTPTRIHVPIFPDTFPQYGLISHRCITQVENDLIFAGRDGISSARRNLQSSEIDSTHISNRVEPTYRHDVGMLTDLELKLHAFLIRDKLHHNTVTHLPGGKAYAYTSDESPKYQSWSTWETPEYTCGCVSFIGRVFYAEGTRIYMQGNSLFDGEKIFADKEHDRDGVWTINTVYPVGALIHDVATNKTFRCTFGHQSGNDTIYDDIAAHVGEQIWEPYLGIPISFELETPWMDSRDPMSMKQARFLSVSSMGTAPFTVKAYVDNLYRNFDSDIVYEPAVQMDFVGNDAVGFGLDSLPYGGGRRSYDARLYKFPVRFKSLKLNMFGATIQPLEIGIVSILFSSGKYKR